MGIVCELDMDPTPIIGNKYITPEMAEEGKWFKVEVHGPTPSTALAEIREWLTSNVNSAIFIYREIFFCCTIWFKYEENAIHFKVACL